MADLNSLSVTGRLTADATMRTIASGKKVLNVPIAVNTGFGEYKKVLYLKVQQWGDKGEKLCPYLKKGSLIAAQGELSRNEWSDSSRTLHVDLVLDSFNIQLLNSNTNTAVVATPVETVHVESVDSIPF